MVPEFQTHGIWEHDKMVIFATKLGVVSYIAVDKGHPCESAFDFSFSGHSLGWTKRQESCPGSLPSVPSLLHLLGVSEAGLS